MNKIILKTFEIIIWIVCDFFKKYKNRLHLYEIIYIYDEKAKFFNDDKYSNSNLY